MYGLLQPRNVISLGHFSFGGFEVHVRPVGRTAATDTLPAHGRTGALHLLLEFFAHRPRNDL